MNIGKYAGIMYLDLHAGEHGVAPAGPVAKRPPKAGPPAVKRPRLNSPGRFVERYPKLISRRTD